MLFVFAIVVGELNDGLVELSQRTIVPVCPDKVNVVLLVPVQTVVPPEIEPPTDVGETVIVPVEL